MTSIHISYQHISNQLFLTFIKLDKELIRSKNGNHVSSLLKSLPELASNQVWFFLFNCELIQKMEKSCSQTEISIWILVSTNGHIFPILLHKEMSLTNPLCLFS